MPEEIEHCPRCHEGVLYTVADREDSYTLRCFTCNYGESRLKDGYQVDEPGSPIRKSEDDAKPKGGTK